MRLFRQLWYIIQIIFIFLGSFLYHGISLTTHTLIHSLTHSLTQRSITPLVLFLIIQFFVPKINAVNNFTGFLCGYFLLIGLLEVLSTPYWSFCILLDIFVFITLQSTVASCDIAVEERSVTASNGELNDILVLPEYVEPEIPEISTAVSDANNRLDEEEEEIKVNEESLPLLRL